MADPSPLLHQDNKPTICIEDMIEHYTSSFSLAHGIQSIFICLAWAFDAQQTFMAVFTDQQPSWHCTAGECSPSADKCSLSEGSWAWDWPKETSIVSDWNLHCIGGNGGLIARLPSAAFHTGSLIGGFLLAAIADSRLGRKTLLLLSSLIMSLAGILTAISPNIWVYSLTRFFAGLGRIMIGSSVLVLSTETVGKRWRGKIGICGFLFFTLGFLSLPLIAYLCRESSWRILYLWVSFPSLFYSVSLYFILHESPRWLFIHGRREEAINTLRKINGKGTPSHLKQLQLQRIGEEIEAHTLSMFSALNLLWKKRWALRRLSLLMVLGFGSGIIYYGMPLALEALNFNHYLSVTFTALSELPSALISFFLIEKLNRRASLISFSFLSAACSVASGLIASGETMTLVQVGLEVVSYFATCTMANVMLIYALELFPTSVRNSALAMVRQSSVLGAALGAVAAAAARERGGAAVSFGVFGLTMGVCGLSAVWLPETRGEALCDTMEEQHAKTRRRDGGN